MTYFRGDVLFPCHIYTLYVVHLLRSIQMIRIQYKRHTEKENKHYVFTTSIFGHIRIQWATLAHSGHFRNNFLYIHSCWNCIHSLQLHMPWDPFWLSFLVIYNIFWSVMHLPLMYFCICHIVWKLSRSREILAYVGTSDDPDYLKILKIGPLKISTFIVLKIEQLGLRNSYTLVCPPVRGDNSHPYRRTNHGTIFLYHPHHYRACSVWNISC